MSDQPTPPDQPQREPQQESQPRPRKRRRVLHTAGLTASAAVLALSIQAGSLNGDDAAQTSSYGDATILDPDDFFVQTCGLWLTCCLPLRAWLPANHRD